MNENTARVIVSVICVIAGIFSYRTKDLDGVKDAFFYRIAYAFMLVRGILFIATDILHLWAAS